MAAFSPDASTEHVLDWTILQNGGVSLYRNRAFLTEDVAKLEAIGYRSVQFNCSTWWTLEKMYDEIEQALRFPAYCGRNLNAVWDCLHDIDVPDVGGLLIVLDGFASFAGGSGSEVAFRLVDLLAGASRYHMLMGRRLILLVQSDDPSLRLDRLAAIDAAWNRREWLNKDRGL
jgi:RNAse (barnase) inhibitor barstar